MNPIQYPPSRGVPPRRPDRTGRRRRGGGFILFGALLILIIVLLLIGTAVYAYINPTGFQSSIGQPFSRIIPASSPSNPATVTITPKNQVVSDTYVIQAVTTAPKADLLQVSLQHLTATPAPQNKTVTGTGHTQTNPTHATGSVTLYNSSSTPVTIGIETFPQLPNGVIVVTDSSVTIPGSTIDANGVLTASSKAVAAHAENTGTIGNIAAQAFTYNNCCNAGLRATNLSAFTGGQDPQNYTFIQQSDVDAVVNPLISTLAQEAKSQFDKQLTSNESLAEDPTCPAPTVNDDPGAIGDTGHNITSMAVTVSATCTGIAYDRTGAQKVAQQRLQKMANITPGQGYVLSGAITSKIIKVTSQDQNAVSLQVQAQGTWGYQVSDAQKTALAKQLAGKKVAAAQTLLNAQAGFKDASIKSSGNNATLPTDPTQIKIDVLAVSGSNNGSSAPGSSTPTPSSNPGTTPTSTVGRGMLPTEILKG
jgi:ribosomal protein S11